MDNFKVDWDPSNPKWIKIIINLLSIQYLLFIQKVVHTWYILLYTGIKLGYKTLVLITLEIIQHTSHSFFESNSVSTNSFEDLQQELFKLRVWNLKFASNKNKTSYVPENLFDIVHEFRTDASSGKHGDCVAATVLSLGDANLDTRTGVSCVQLRASTVTVLTPFTSEDTKADATSSPQAHNHITLNTEQVNTN